MLERSPAVKSSPVSPVLSYCTPLIVSLRAVVDETIFYVEKHKNKPLDSDTGV